MFKIIARFKFVFVFISALFSLHGIAHAVTGTVSLGQSVTLSVSASGTAPFSYQWYKDGAALSGAKSAQYTISSVAAVNIGVYQAVVANSAGSTSSDQATLVMVSLINFTTQPSSQTVVAGAKVTFTAAASGVPTPTYQWRKNGTNISGATSASYSISSVGSGDAGTYSVVASNLLGSATSNNAVLTVNAAAVAPAFTTQPTGRTVTSGSSVTFTSAASGAPSPTYQWRKNGTNISGATSASYMIGSASTSSAGTYSVVASNSAGSVTSNGAVLTVNAAPVTAAPVFTTQPVSKTVAPGSSVTFTVVASGSPSPTYQWRKNGTNISGATGTSCTINNISSSSAGTYYAVATNSAGSVNSSGAVLTVNTSTAAPSFTTQPSSKTVSTGSSVTFTSLASGTPSPTYQWRKNGTSISGATSASYTISSVSSSSAGTYSVVATNSAGSATSNGAVLTIGTAVSSIKKVDFNADGKNDLILQNLSTGECMVCLMNGTSMLKSVSVATFDPSWRVCGAGDFNGDGKADILMQNQKTGQCVVRLMNGTTLGTSVTLSTQSTVWRISGSGDFNGDGNTDILWQNTSTGEATLSLMSGTQVKTTVSLGTMDTAWQISGTGDFNGDGDTDIVWQNVKTGECIIWYMDGDGTSGHDSASFGTFDTAWQISGAGDFDGDGKADLLWQNVETGECSIWTMSGMSVKSKISLGTGSTDWVMRN